MIFRFSESSAASILRWSRKSECAPMGTEIVARSILQSIQRAQFHNWKYSNWKLKQATKNFLCQIQIVSATKIIFWLLFRFVRAPSASRHVACTQSNWMNPLQFSYLARQHKKKTNRSVLRIQLSLPCALPAIGGIVDFAQQRTASRTGIKLN